MNRRVFLDAAWYQRLPTEDPRFPTEVQRRSACPSTKTPTRLCANSHPANVAKSRG